MRKTYLQVTYREGKPFAAYLYIDRQSDEKVSRSRPIDDDVVLDFSADGRLLGIEFISPALLNLNALNEALSAASVAPVSATDLAPLLAA